MNEDNKPLYQIEDDEDFQSDYVNHDAEGDSVYGQGGSGLYAEEELPLAYGQADPDAAVDDDYDEPETGTKRKVSSPWTLLLRVMFGPVDGWRELKRSKLKSDRMAALCFLPMTFISALSGLASAFYMVGAGVVQYVVGIVVTFVSYFFGYFLLPIVAKPFLGDKANIALDTPFGRNAMMMCFVTLEIFGILGNLLPSLEPVIVFLPLWTIYLIHRLVPVMKVPKERWAYTTIVLSVLVIGLPAVWDYLLSLLLK